MFKMHIWFDVYYSQYKAEYNAVIQIMHMFKFVNMKIIFFQLCIFESQTNKSTSSTSVPNWKKLEKGIIFLRTFKWIFMQIVVKAETVYIGGGF